MLPNQKVSIVIPNYKDDKYLENTLKSLLSQTYKNIEIVLICDEPSEEKEKLIKKYLAKDNRIKYIKNDKKQGKFKARLNGIKETTGEYIAFLDTNTYVSIDFYRSLMYKASETNADVVIGDIVFEKEDGDKTIYNLTQLPLKDIEGKECFLRYFEQAGLNPFWNKIWNKIYSRKIIEEALKEIDNLDITIEYTTEFVLSTLLFYYANKISRIDNDNVFGIEEEKKVVKEKLFENAEEVVNTFSYVEDFLKREQLKDTLSDNLYNWKRYFYQDLIDRAGTINNSAKKEVEEKLKKLGYKHKELLDKNYFKCVKSVWNDNLERIKRNFANPEIKYVSFDVFDTLVVRPFLNPTDLFAIVDKEFRKYTNNSTGMDFTKIRIFSEIQTRNKLQSKTRQDITLDEIYETMEEEYHISKDILEKTKQKEIEYEIRFCTRRNTGYELYQMALSLGKKVICTSDMYLPKEVVKEILDKNGYTNLSNIYVSSEFKITKASKDLFKYVLEKEKISAKQMSHIGDNYFSDYENPRKIGIKAEHLPKASDIFQDKNVTHNLSLMFNKSLPMWRDNKNALNFLGIRCMMGIIANKYFDNPYKTFNYTADFNVDPYLIGYYALGMYMFGLTKWILDDVQGKNYEKMVFMARDGYLPIKCYNILGKLYKELPKAEYLYISRKALVPITIQTELDLYKLSEVINVTNHSPRDILKYIKDCITIKDEKEFENICKENKIKMDEDFEIIEKFDKFINLVIENLYDKEKQAKNLQKYREYFKGIFGNHSATFDIGYSARPEMFLSNLLKMPIDTYFCNINHSEAQRHAQIGGFKLKTFFDAKPTTTGHAYEMMLSALAPSCIGYDLSGEKVTPIFEKYENTYTVEFAMTTMQKAAEEFVADMVNIFEDDIDVIYYQNYYISLPFMAYINSSKEIDKMPFSSVIFEDNVGIGEPLKMVKNWTQDLSTRNQATMDNLFNIDNDISEFLGENELVYNSTVDLKDRNKFIRLIYYALFDKKTLQRRIGDICYKNRVLWAIYKAIKYKK